MGEPVAAVGAALVMTWLGTRLHVNPIERVGQVSGLAGVQLRVLLLLAVVVGLYTLVARRSAGPAVRLAAAGVSGLATGTTAAGLVVALRGTAWPLNASRGDAGQLQSWAYGLLHGWPMPPEYPPGFPHMLAWTAEFFYDGDVGHAMKWLMIVLTALLGPAAYLSWRLVLSPLWALGIGVTAMLPLVDPYKPYSAMMLVVIIPVIAKLLETLQKTPLLGRAAAVRRGAGLGAVLGVVCLVYSGWFVWSAVGVLAATTVVLVRLWRESGPRALVTAVLSLSAALAAFLLLAGNYVYHLLVASGTTKDGYHYFDTNTDPAYFAMWGGDTPGPQRLIGLPPLGELGGVGLFTVLLLVGLGFALALGGRRAVVLTAAACTASSFLLRYWYASHMERDQLVQLYPRTSAEILYCMIVLSGFALLLVAGRIRAWQPGLFGSAGADRPVAPRRGVAVGALCALGLMFAFAGSATANTYMPDKQPGAPGQLAWWSHIDQTPDGKCPKYSPLGEHCNGPYTPPTKPVPTTPAK